MVYLLVGRLLTRGGLRGVLGGGLCAGGSGSNGNGRLRAAARSAQRGEAEGEQGESAWMRSRHT